MSLLILGRGLERGVLLADILPGLEAAGQVSDICAEVRDGHAQLLHCVQVADRHCAVLQGVEVHGDRERDAALVCACVALADRLA